MEWKVELVKMTGNTVLAEAVNHFHEILFENSVKETKQLAQDGSGLFYMGEHVDFRHYSRNIHTIKCFYWGKVFTVVDVKNTHMPMIGGVSIVSANFNVETGKNMSWLICMENILNQEIKSIICEDDGGLWSELWNIG